MPQKILFSFLIYLFSIHTFSQTERSVEGPMDHMTKDSIIYFKSGNSSFPAVGQEVEISREFSTSKVGFNMNGTMGIADGKYLGKSGALHKVQVTLWTSSIMVNGKNDAHPKVGQNIILEWIGEESLADQSVALIKSGKYDEAIVLLDSAILLAPDQSNLYYFRGVSHYRNYDQRKAAPDFTKYLDKFPTNQDALVYRALSYGKFWKYEEAIADVKKIDLSEQSEGVQALIHKNMCKWYVSLEQFDEACTSADKLAALDPTGKYAPNFKRQHCVDEKIADDKKSCVLTSVISSTADKVVEVEVISEVDGCYLGGIAVVSVKDMQVGQLVSLAECSKNSKMGEGVFKVKSINKSKITLEPWYWSIHVNDEPVASSFRAGDNWIIEW